MYEQLIGAGIAILATLFGATLQYIFQFFTEKRARNQVLEDRQLVRRREIFDKRAADVENFIQKEFDSLNNLIQSARSAISGDLKEGIALLKSLILVSVLLMSYLMQY